MRATVTVTATRPAVADAFEAVARSTTAVTDTLRGYGVSGPDLATTGLPCTPRPRGPRAGAAR
nr:hypothetical protein [Rhodococcus opacus]